MFCLYVLQIPYSTRSPRSTKHPVASTAEGGSYSKHSIVSRTKAKRLALPESTTTIDSHLDIHEGFDFHSTLWPPNRGGFDTADKDQRCPVIRRNEPTNQKAEYVSSVDNVRFKSCVQASNSMSFLESSLQSSSNLKPDSLGRSP